MTTLSDGTITVTLPDGLHWVDELQWAAVGQTVERSITGALLVQSAPRVLGRPITLQADSENSGFVARSVLDQIRVWADAPGKQLTLTYRGAGYTVAFRHQDTAVDARPVIPYDDVDPADWYRATLRFMVTA